MSSRPHRVPATVSRHRRWVTSAAALALLLSGCAAPQGQPGSAGPSTDAAAPAPMSSTAATPDSEPTDEAVPTARSHTGVPMRAFTADERPPQFVLFSFDGGRQNERWTTFLDAAQDSGAFFTVFQSGINLLTDENREKYTAPGNKPGYVNTELGGTRETVAERIGNINEAYRRGHEIGTHYNGHLCATADHGGDKWTTKDWKTELTNFHRFLADPRGVNGFGEDFPELEVPAEAIQGNRLPCLDGAWDQLVPAWKAFGIEYDTSKTSGGAGVAWPYRKDGIWEFEMPVVYAPVLTEMKAKERHVMAMDYNFWMAGNRARGVKDDTAWLTQFQLDTYRYMYASAFHGNRAPLVFGNHFNDWAGNAFNPAEEAAMREMCGREETYCITYQQMVDWLELQDPAVLEHWQSLPVAADGTDVDTLSWRP